MKTEIELARKVHEKFGFEIRDTKPKRIERDEGAARRRAIRIESDAIIRQGLMASNLEEVAVGIAGTMSAVAGGCLQFGIEPDINDLVTAAKELIEDARVVLDNGYALSELDQVAVGSVMLHVLCTGLAACLGVPYKSVLECCNAAYIEGKQVERAQITELFTRSKALSGEGAVSVPDPDDSAQTTPSGHTSSEIKGNGGNGGNGSGQG